MYDEINKREPPHSLTPTASYFLPSFLPSFLPCSTDLNFLIRLCVLPALDPNVSEMIEVH
jgi:hypothetical protein